MPRILISTVSREQNRYRTNSLAEFDETRGGLPFPLPLSDHKKASSLDDRIRGRGTTKFPNYERRRPPSVVLSFVNAPSWPKVQLELNRFRSCNHWKPLANYYWSRSHSIITVRHLFRSLPPPPAPDKPRHRLVMVRLDVVVPRSGTWSRQTQIYRSVSH